MHGDLQKIQPVPSLTVFQATAIKTWLLQQLEARPEGMVLDLSEIDEIDTAGVQLLLMIKREAQARSCSVVLDSPSETVRDVFHLLGLSNELQQAGQPDSDCDATGRHSGKGP